LDKRIIRLSVGVLKCSSMSKLRHALHMIEGGTIKLDDTGYYTLKNNEKINYIKANWGDSDNLVIMYNYIQEGVKLREAFEKATILHGETYAEGVDLSMYATLVVYSQDFKTSKYSQRR